MRLVVLAVFVAVTAWARDPFALQTSQGELEKEVIQHAVNLRMNEVQACAERALLEKPGLTPKVVVEFVIGLDGKVSGEHVVGTTPADAGYDGYGACLLEVVRGLRFSKKPRGGPVRVQYPFLVCGVGY